MIYLDNAATSMPKAPGVTEAMKAAADGIGNAGRGGYAASMRASDIIFSTRRKAATLFNAPDADNVVFTLNATHAINIAIHDMCRRGRRIVVSPYEHNAVMRALKLNRACPVVADAPQFDRDKLLAAFRNAIRSGADGVVCTHVSNVFGWRLPVEDVAEICRRQNIPLLIDASQSAGVLDIDHKKLGAKYIAMPGHKGLYGPQGTGILLCTADTLPLMAGGTGSNSRSFDMPDFLPDRLEAGTQNLPGIAGLGCGLDYVLTNGCRRIAQHERALTEYAAERLRETEGVKIHWPEDKMPDSGVLSFNLGQIPSEQTAELLAARQIAVRAGYHCAPLAHRTMGTLGNGTVRISVSHFSSRSDIDALVDAVKEI